MSSTSRDDAVFVSRPTTLLGVFLLSLSLLLGELLLTRVFSVIFMYHFAFMVISLALFGLGVGGIAVYLFPERFGGDLQRRLVTLTLVFTCTLVLLVLFLFNLPLAASGGLRGTLTWVAVYVFASFPFFLGGTCLSILLGRSGQQVNRLYFVDLVGAGVSCLAIIPLLNHLGGVTALLSSSAVAATAALMFALPEPPAGAARARSGVLLQRTLLIIAIGLAAGALITLVAEPLAAWVGNQLFHSHPVYGKRAKSFQYYFETLIQPEIRRVSGGARGPLIGGFVLSAAALVYVTQLRSRAQGMALLARNELRWTAAAVLAAVIGVVAINGATDAIRIRFAKGRVEFQNLFEGWNSFSRIAVLPREGSKVNAYAWGLSPLYKGPMGEQLALDIDSLAGTPLVKFDGDFNGPGLEHLGHDITALAYVLRPARRTLVIGPGGGRDVLTALKFGTKDVTAVELNPIIVDVVNKHFGDFTGRLYERPEVHLTIDDGRHFVRSTRDTFGVVQLALVDTWASSAAGAFALSENTLYTTEAFYDYLDRLEPDGVLTITRWLENPPRETLRVVSLARAALGQLGITDISRHILVSGTPPLRRSHRFASVIVSRRPFTDDEIARAREFVEQKGFDVIYFPGMARDPIFSELITTKDADGFYARYELDVAPCGDDRPFFFNSVKPRDFLRPWLEKPGRMGVQVLAQLVLIVSVLVGMFMFLPLMVRKRSALVGVDPLARWSTLVYFGALGAGFMLIEVSLISKFVIFLGHPIYSLTIVLCSLLISAGFGSYFSGRYVGEGHDALRRVILCELAAIVVLSIALEGVTGFLTDAAFPVRALIAILILGFAGFFMGMPFPLGLRLLDRAGPQWAQLIPWVWGINGATSVLGSVIAISVAINLGFRVTLLVGLCTYGVALAASAYLAGGTLPVRVKEPERVGAAVRDGAVG